MASLSNNDIAQAIYLVSKDKTGSELENVNKKIVKFLSRRRLLPKTKDILERLNKIINSKDEVLEIKISSASKIDETIRKQIVDFIKKHYGAKEVKLNEKIDEKLIGGIKIEIDDEIIDLTVKNKIKKLKDHLTRKI